MIFHAKQTNWNSHFFIHSNRSEFHYNGLIWPKSWTSLIFNDPFRCIYNGNKLWERHTIEKKTEKKSNYSTLAKIINWQSLAWSTLKLKQIMYSFWNRSDINDSYLPQPIKKTNVHPWNVDITKKNVLLFTTPVFSTYIKSKRRNFLVNPQKLYSLITS